MSHARYIIARINGEEVPIVFPDHPCRASHRHLAQAFPGEVVAAGYCDVETWAAFGEAITVDLKSRGAQDTLLLFSHFSGADAATLSALRSMIEPATDPKPNRT